MKKYELHSIDSNTVALRLQMFYAFCTKYYCYLFFLSIQFRNKTKFHFKLSAHNTKLSSLKIYQNMNAFMAVMIGICNQAVSRLSSTWERIPAKYRKMIHEFEQILVSI